jgi:hypothetical protein
MRRVERASVAGDPLRSLRTHGLDDVVTIGPEPAVDHRRRYFDVKLKTDQPPLQEKCLILADRGGSPTAPILWDIEHIAMPVQNHELLGQVVEQLRRHIMMEMQRSVTDLAP